MNKEQKLYYFTYNRNKGPVPSDELEQPIKEGNCRLAVQIYFYKVYGIILEPDQLLNPKAFYHTGSFVLKEMENDAISFQNKDILNILKRGDMIYAEKRNGLKNSFADENSRLISLHTAVYLDKLDDNLSLVLPEPNFCSKNTSLIWHATSVGGGCCIWPVNKFEERYKIIAVKRLLSSDFNLGVKDGFLKV